ncbi:hypothetical protein ATHL_02163, partial [Anaerolinea thermolimosa]
DGVTLVIRQGVALIPVPSPLFYQYWNDHPIPQENR